MQRYGRTDSEKDAEKSTKCREIVNEIMRFGVDQGQVLQIIELLAMELEDREAMLAIANLMRDLRKGPIEGSTLLMPGSETD